MNPQPLENSDSLARLREKFAPVDAMMRQGIFTDEDTGRQYFTGYSYRTLYDWDQYFEAIVQIYMGWPSDYIRNAVTIFLDHQQPSGMISRSAPSNEFHDPEHVKPFLAQTSLLVAKYYGETDWLRGNDYLPKMRRYIDYWLNDMDADKCGLSEWMSAPHTGMDNQHERAGHWLDRFCEGVDLNCYIVRELRAFATLLETLGAGGDGEAAAYRLKAEERAARIREKLWDDVDGIFYDRNMRSGEPLKVRYAGLFAVLWANVATPDQAKRMVRRYLFNPSEFWTHFPVASLSRREKGYTSAMLPGDLGCNWRAMTWMPVNYYIYHGLRNYGYGQLASILEAATTALVEKSGDREYYDSETGDGQGLDPFWGWSLLGRFMEYEEGCKADVTSVEADTAQ